MIFLLIEAKRFAKTNESQATFVFDRIAHGGIPVLSLKITLLPEGNQKLRNKARDQKNKDPEIIYKPLMVIPT